MDDEAIKFAHMTNFLHEGGKDGGSPEPRSATIECPDSSSARKLRRRLYYLREQTSGELRARADKLAFRLIGRIVTVELMPEWQPEFKNDSKDQPIAPESD